MDDLEEKIEKSLEEGFTKDEILQVMKEQGYTQHEIGKALAHLND